MEMEMKTTAVQVHGDSTPKLVQKTETNVQPQEAVPNVQPLEAIRNVQPKEAVPNVQPQEAIPNEADPLMADRIETDGNDDERSPNDGYLYTRRDVKKLAKDNPDKVYLVIFNNVFDFNPLFEKCPDLLRIFTPKSGHDATDEFRRVCKQKKDLEFDVFEYCIGRLVQRDWREHNEITVTHLLEQEPELDVGNSEYCWNQRASNITTGIIVGTLFATLIFCIAYATLSDGSIVGKHVS